MVENVNRLDRRRRVRTIVNDNRIAKRQGPTVAVQKSTVDIPLGFFRIHERSGYDNHRSA